MPRKSRELRLSQTEDIISEYEAAGIKDDRNCRFARDMLLRLQRGRTLSPKQRNWLDNIIEQGVPEVKGNTELFERIESASNVEGMTDFDSNILREFAGKIRRGWNLSEKQSAWMDQLVKKAEDIQENGPWIPDAETIDQLKSATLVAKSYSTVYWQNHGGTYKALRNVESFIEGTGTIDEWSCNKLLKAMARPLRELSNPKYDIGKMYWHRGQPAMIVSGPVISEQGHIVYSVLSGGRMIVTNNISKMKK